MKNLVGILLILMLLTSCTLFETLNDSITSGLRVSQDSYDDATLLTQPLVSAGHHSEPWHMLGFIWKANIPDRVLLIAGTFGVQAITGLEFKIDDTQDIISPKLATQALTQIHWPESELDVVTTSSKIFAVTYDDFVKLAKANKVRMKLNSIDTYTVSTFGKQVGYRTINAKFNKFVLAIQEHSHLSLNSL